MPKRLTLAALLCATPALAQTPTIHDNTRRAAEIIDAAVAAHGGVEALRAARQAHVVIEGHEYHRYQSRRVDGPLDSTVMRHVLRIDLARDRVVSDLTRGYPGGFYYTNRRAYSPGEDVRYVDLRNRTYATQPAGPNDVLGATFPLPQFQLLAAHESNPRLRRYLGRLRLASGTVVDAVSLPLPNGNTVTFGFDPATHHLRADLGVALDPLDAQAVAETELLDYRTIGGLLLPTRRIAYRGRDTLSDVRFTSAQSDYQVADSLLAAPAGFERVPTTAPEPTVATLAPGVWKVHARGGASLLVELSDHLLVIDASPFVAREVLARADSLAPGKRVRYVVPTHHHDDHFTGVRLYAAAGATTITTRGNLDYFRRVVSNPGLPVTLETPPVPDAKVEPLMGRSRTFGAGARTVEIHDIGPNGHAEAMLVAWLPAEGILFQADLVEAPAGVARPGANAEATLQLADWIRRQGLVVRTFAGAHGTLASPAEFTKLVGYPVVKP